MVHEERHANGIPAGVNLAIGKQRLYGNWKKQTRSRFRKNINVMKSPAQQGHPPCESAIASLSLCLSLSRAQQQQVTDFYPLRASARGPIFDWA